MNNTQSNMMGALGGAVITGIAWWDRLDRETQRQIDRARDAAASANDKINSWLASSDYVRMLVPTSRDFQIGIAYSTAPSTPAQTIPNLNASLNRPQISQESAARNYQWPPKAGEYDDTGRNKSVGELTTLALALTYEEVRSFLLGITQNGTMTAECKAQIYRVSNALTAVACEMNLTLDQYKDAFRRLFGASTSTSDPHVDLARPPSASPLLSGLSIVPLNPSVVSGSYFNQNTDAAHHFRVTTPSGGVPAGTVLASITFGGEYKYRRADGTVIPFQPAIPSSYSTNSMPGALFAAAAVTSTGYQLVNIDSLNANAPYDVHMAVVAGQGVVP